MSDGISRIAVNEYLPVIRAFLASMEIERATMKDYDSAPRLGHEFLESRFDHGFVMGAMDLIEVWLRGTQFTGGYGGIRKLDPSVSWVDLINLLHEKIDDYANGAPIIVLGLLKTGLMTRELNGQIFECPFETDKMKLKIILALHNGECVPTIILQRILESKSEDSVSKMIEKINSATRVKLRLPKLEKLIKNDSGSGYYINPIYNLVVTK